MQMQTEKKHFKKEKLKNQDFFKSLSLKEKTKKSIK